MASGLVIAQFDARCGTPPAASYAGLDTIAGGATPAEALPVLDFDPAASEYYDFLVPAMPSAYSAGGLTLLVKFGMSSDVNTAHKVRWEVGIRRLDTAEDLGAVHAYDTNGVSVAIPDDVQKTTTGTITFTDGADIDSWAAGEPAIIRIYRDHDHVDDDATGDAELRGLFARET